MHGGISLVSKRFAKANNSKFPGYDPEKPTTNIIYMSNLYGGAISMMHLPTGGFAWEEVQNQKEDTEKKGLSHYHPMQRGDSYPTEFCLEYVQKLHEAHSYYPLTPELMKVGHKWYPERWRSQCPISKTRTNMLFIIECCSSAYNQQGMRVKKMSHPVV